MAIRKRSPKERKYEIWTVFMCYLIYKDPSVSEKERTMFGTLAYRMLSKAAEAVPTKEVRGFLPAPSFGADWPPRNDYLVWERESRIPKSFPF